MSSRIHKLGDLFESSKEKGWQGLPLLSVTLRDGLVPRQSLDRRTDTNIDAEDHLLVKEGYLAYNMMRVWQGALGMAESDGIVSPAYVVLKPTSQVSSVYAKYLFKSSRMIYLFWAYSYGLTKDRLRLYYNDFSKISIKLPDIPEQKKIAQILATWDKAITTTEQLLANSQQQKKALMQQLLTGKKRLLDDKYKNYSEPWKIKPIAELASVIMGSSPKSNFYNSDRIGLPLIQGNADIKNKKSCPRIYTAEVTKECKPRDILLSVRAPVGSVAISLHHACIGRGVATIRALEYCSQEFLYQWLGWFEPRWRSFSQGSTFESINSADIKQLKIRLPEIFEQRKIAAVLSSTDQEVELIQNKLECLNQEKKALMQQLLTGKRRVKLTEDVA